MISHKTKVKRVIKIKFKPTKLLIKNSLTMAIMAMFLIKAFQPVPQLNRKISMVVAVEEQRFLNTMNNRTDTDKKKCIGKMKKKHRLKFTILLAVKATLVMGSKSSQLKKPLTISNKIRIRNLMVRITDGTKDINRILIRNPLLMQGERRTRHTMPTITSLVVINNNKSHPHQDKHSSTRPPWDEVRSLYSGRGTSQGTIVDQPQRNHQ